jgi:hypothetical protein
MYKIEKSVKNMETIDQSTEQLRFLLQKTTEGLPMRL